jgi:hypothetical protein
MKQVYKDELFSNRNSISWDTSKIILNWYGPTVNVVVTLLKSDFAAK